MKLIIGTGKTGQSCANYFARKNIAYKLLDTRTLSDQDKILLANTKEIILSPGIDPALFPNHKIISDIELFAREAKAPIIGITGTNAKGTVTTLLTNMINACNKTALMGGNIGIPALDLLEHEIPDFYVLEISSFQLEITEHLPCIASVILNISPDHLDRHKTMDNYIAAKQRIYLNSQNCIYNLDDSATFPRISPSALSGLLLPSKISPVARIERSEIRGNIIGFGLKDINLLPISELKIKGLHNYSNALAALTIGKAIGLQWDKMIDALKQFPGLEHRCEWVATQHNITWINDSKGTNIGATIAALEGLGTKNNIILIAGGQGKGADFNLLKPSVDKYTREVILYGQDAQLISKALNKTTITDSLKSAVVMAQKLAQPGDIVLLSPACASWDMFKDFEDRGRQFKDLVKECIAHEVI
ncbi:MAG TPA: UDP-N-acetylmuramoyl-L-alanine--D-glutamate ligase [Gammaproteobacteria bacterium]|nr:UDP-N-acetylmuramoyl-L-alanine--D-glutamate ligase [Gammaproteobacteria bacterium]